MIINIVGGSKYAIGDVLQITEGARNFYGIILSFKRDGSARVLYELEDFTGNRKERRKLIKQATINRRKQNVSSLAL